MAGSSTDHFMPAISRHWRIVSGFVHAVLKARFDEKISALPEVPIFKYRQRNGKSRFPVKALGALNDQKVIISATRFLKDFRSRPRPVN